MSSLDTLLRESLERLAQPGDPAGVADAIRSQVPGGSGGPSTGGPSGLSGLRAWGPWVALAAVLGVGGAALGASGAIGGGDNGAPGVSGSVNGGVVAYGCPGGGAVETLQPGQRVLATLRSADGGYVAVRDPFDLGRTVWLPTGVVVVDDGQPAVGTLDVGGCPEPSVEPSPSTTPTTKPTHKPTKKPDTEAPDITATKWTHETIVGTNGPHPSESCTPDDYEATLTVTAHDNEGTPTVSAKASFGDAHVKLLNHSGNTWKYRIRVAYNNGASGTKVVKVTFKAHDAAGNTSSTSRSITVTSSGSCLG